MVRVKLPRHHSSISNRAFVLVLESQSKLALTRTLLGRRLFAVSIRTDDQSSSLNGLVLGEMPSSTHQRKWLSIASRLNGPAPLATNKASSTIYSTSGR